LDTDYKEVQTDLCLVKRNNSWRDETEHTELNTWTWARWCFFVNRHQCDLVRYTRYAFDFRTQYCGAARICW
jgi:hypothetical protein